MNYEIPLDELLKKLKSSKNGITQLEAKLRLKTYGKNILPSRPPPTIIQIFFHQFLNPLIYILLFAAIFSISIGDYNDAVFIGLVLLINSIIGTIQEYGAEKSAQALKKLVASKVLVERNEEIFEIDATEIVPGDVIILESGSRVGADMRLILSHSLEADESLLTGESFPAKKDHKVMFDAEVPLAEQSNMIFAGSLISRGKAKGVVVSTGKNTELGKIATELSDEKEGKAPLLIRIEQFTKNISVILLIAVSLMAIILLLRGQNLKDVIMLSVAMAVSAIPEGLPVAITVALALATRRMAKRNVIVRRLPAVEALGSCTFIATDKTGTLTVNQLTVEKIVIPNIATFNITGSGLDPKGEIRQEDGKPIDLKELITIGLLCNDATIAHRDGEYIGHGDPVDLALLVLANKFGLKSLDYEMVEEIPFDSENAYEATFHKKNNQGMISIKGASEKIVPFCSTMIGGHEINKNEILKSVDELAAKGYRVLALAKKESTSFDAPLNEQLNNMIFIGLVGMIDPIRPEAGKAIELCKKAGIDVAILTGDHPKTTFAIAKKIGLVDSEKEIVTGMELSEANESQREKLIERSRVFSRVDPRDKLEIVKTLIKKNRFIAVTGDGVNDAPALKASHVGIAMGKSGTDVAKEASDLIIADDRFISIVAGIEEGRIAYANIRKVVYLLVSTGASEIFLFLLSIIFNVPMPLTAVQVLWLNLVTNGIQDVALVFDPGEGDELKKKPRSPDEPIFDRPMIERVVLSALVIGIISFWKFYGFLGSGLSEFSARNLTLMLMVFFENVMILNCRSETHSAFSRTIFSNPLLVIGTISAQIIHIIATMHPLGQKVLQLEPVSLSIWLELLGISLSILMVMEIYKFLKSKMKFSP